MVKQRINILIICIISSITFVGGLYKVSLQAGNYKNGFIRLLPTHKIIGINYIDVQYNSWYLSGKNDENVFLGNRTAINKILKVNDLLNQVSYLDLSGFDELPIYKGATVYIDSLGVFLNDGVTPTILKGNVSDLHLVEKLKTSYFTGIVSLTDHSFALRYVNIKKENILAKLTTGSDSLIATNILKRQVDGLFCTDGEMVKVPGSSKMIYVYYYRNQFLCTDSNLNLLYKGKTIDTISHAQIKVSKIKSTGQITMAAPPLYVNKRACANEKYLFIQSALRANNETDYMIKDVSMIDVYSIKDGKYQFSFYLPDFRGFKVRDFKVYGQSLYALYDHYLYKYQLNF